LFLKINPSLFYPSRRIFENVTFPFPSSGMTKMPNPSLPHPSKILPSEARCPPMPSGSVMQLQTGVIVHNMRKIGRGKKVKMQVLL